MACGFLLLDNGVDKNLILQGEQAMRRVETIFSELLKQCPRYQFEKAVEQYQGDRYVKSFKTWQQYITILYAQIKEKDSLRDIETSPMSQSARWHHLGLTGVKKSTLLDANNRRDYRIFEGLFYHLLNRCRNLTPKHKFRFKNPLYTIDATTIDLCLSLFPWAKFRKTKGAVKMHCLYDHFDFALKLARLHLTLASEFYNGTFLSLRALLITDTELKLMAAAAIMGDSSNPKTG